MRVSGFLTALVLTAAQFATAREAVVFVGAHPDDTEGFAGAAFLLKDAYDLHVVDLTRGENGLGLAGRLDGSTERLRMREEEKACAILGATPHFLHDVNGAAEMTRASVDALVHILTNLNPVAVFMHWPVDGHPDHIQATAAAMHALRIAKLRPERYFYEVVPGETENWHPIYSVDISATMADKLRVMRAYVCQNANDSIAVVKEKQARRRGAERKPQVRYAETYTTFSGRRIKGGVLERLAETAVSEPTCADCSLFATAPVAGDSDRIESLIGTACSNGTRTATIARNPARSDGTWLIDRAILLPDDFTLVIDDCTVQLAPGTQDNLIRNVGAQEDSIATNRNITVRGKGRAVLCGGTENHYAPRRSGDVNGWPTIGILFCAVDGFVIENLTLRETQCWGISLENGTCHGRVSGIRFEDTNKMRNQDGVDIRKGCSHIVVEDISGVVGDDAVALTGYRRNKLPAARIRRMQIGGYRETAHDDIHDISIRNVRARSAGGHGIVRLLCQDGVKMYNVTVRDVVDTTAPGEPQAQAAIRIGDVKYWQIRPAELGDMHDITIENVTSHAKLGVWVKGALSNARIDGVKVDPGVKAIDVTAPVRNVTADGKPLVARE